MIPLRPEHADKVESIPGSNPRFAIRRRLEGYAYPMNGNVHNPTPRYLWELLVDGRLVDTSNLKRTLVQAARVNGHRYIAEVDTYRIRIS